MTPRFIEHAGCRLLLMDFSRASEPAVTVARITEARIFVAALPKKKDLLTLVDVTSLRFNDEILKAFRELIKHDEPWEHAVAVYGLSGMGALAFRAQNLLTGGRMSGFAGREEALSWLVRKNVNRQGQH